MTSPVDLCNRALGQIVARTSIAGINPPSPADSKSAQAASLYYQGQVDATFRAAHWNSARLQGDLTLLAAAVGTPENPSGKDANGNTLPIPPIPWRYMYAYPEDCLAVRFVVPQNLPAVGTIPLMSNMGVSQCPLVNTSLPFVPAIAKNPSDPFGSQIRVILTNARMAQAVYTGRIDNPDLWDASLQNAVVGVLAAWFCMPITGDKPLMGMRTQLAVALINAARISDGNEGITSIDHVPDFMQVRESGSGYIGYGTESCGFVQGWDAIGMPNGVSY